MREKNPVVAELAGLSGEERRERLLRGAEAEGKLSFYTSTAPEDIQSLLMAFGMRYPFIQPEMVRDKGTVLRERITREYSDGASAADVIELTEINLGKLKARGLLQPFSSPEGEAYGELQESEGYWVAEQKNFLVLAWNTELLKSASPQDYDGLLDPILKGKVTVEAHDACWMAALMNHWGTKRGAGFFSSFGPQIGGLVTGHQIIAERIAAGSLLLSPTIHSNNSEWLKRRSLAIDWLPLEPVVVELVGIALPANPPHPHAALLLIDFILSLEGQRILRLWKRVPGHPALEADPPYMSRGFASILVDAKQFLQRESEFESLWEELIVKQSGQVKR
ncbi:MAG: extracellular solute-binding protein [Deltaproteobacteria bacterium]|nr:extracellular solute-binding protein [Deltaproteobacteria bacterium]